MLAYISKPVYCMDGRVGPTNGGTFLIAIADGIPIKKIATRIHPTIRDQLYIAQTRSMRITSTIAILN